LVRGTVKARRAIRCVRGRAGDGTTRAAEGDELLHVSLRYKKPGESSSRLITKALRSRDCRSAFRTICDSRHRWPVGMLLRDSEYKDRDSRQCTDVARGAMGRRRRYRAEFVQLVERWRGWRGCRSSRAA
jgi:Ca-activated chloride channel family protein